MNTKILKAPITMLFFSLIFSINTIAQSAKVNILQDQKFEQLLNEKRKINNSLVSAEGYRIQIYSGDNKNSRKELTKFKSEFDYLDATIIFNTPDYKVWVGNFKFKIDAERHLLEIKKKYSNSIIIKPSKQF